MGPVRLQLVFPVLIIARQGQWSIKNRTRAYGVSSVFAEFTLGGGTGESAISSAGGTTTYKFDLPPVKKHHGGGGESIWKSSWQKLDVATIRANRTAAIAKGLSKDPRYAPRLNKPIQ